VLRISAAVFPCFQSSHIPIFLKPVSKTSVISVNLNKMKRRDQQALRQLFRYSVNSQHFFQVTEILIDENQTLYFF
jgi:hypothetical protein